ncbi:MAG: hypothetical protein ACI9F2_001184 [Lysobacterales bacterium]|jgi:hypothetical protein
MASSSFISKIRHFDNVTAKWLMRHFYFIFFQIILVILFLFWFTNLFSIIDFNIGVPNKTFTDTILTNQATTLSVMVFLMLLNSFWMLYMFNCIIRIMHTQKDMSYTLSRMRHQKK